MPFNAHHQNYLQPGIARASSIGAWSEIGMRGFLKRPAGDMLLWFAGVPFLTWLVLFCLAKFSLYICLVSIVCSVCLG